MTDTKRDKPQPAKTFPERLTEVLDSWQKLVLALTGLIVAVIGLTVAGLKAWHTLDPQNPNPAHSHSAAPNPAPRNSPAHSPKNSPTTAPAVGPGKLLGSDTVTVPNSDSLTYESASGEQPMFDYYGSLDYIAAGSNVELAVLAPPPPAKNAAYQACEMDKRHIRNVTLNGLEVGNTLCAFLPNHEVAWIRFLPTQADPNNPSIKVAVITWQGPGS